MIPFQSWYGSDWWASSWWDCDWFQGDVAPQPADVSKGSASLGMAERMGIKGGYTLVPTEYLMPEAAKSRLRPKRTNRSPEFVPSLFSLINEKKAEEQEEQDLMEIMTLLEAAGEL